MQNISPFFRSPFTDLTAGLISHQVPGSPCRQIEMEMMECIEAYGVDRGVRKCRCLIDDFHECTFKTKQFNRFLAMLTERKRQIECGKLTGDKKYLNPRIDSY